MIRYHIKPTAIAVKAFRREIKVRAKLEQWRKARQSDPTLTLAEVVKQSRRIRKMLGE